MEAKVRIGPQLQKSPTQTHFFDIYYYIVIKNIYVV